MGVRRFGPGDDTFHGTPFQDSFFGGGGDDTLYGAGANDLISGDDGNDCLFGEAGRDNLLGKAGADTLDGGADGDFLFGGQGVDALYGRAGNDQLSGTGSDPFVSDGVSDRLFGGDGNDQFVGYDRSRDFMFGEGGNDVISAVNDVVRGGPGQDLIDVGASPELVPTAGRCDVTLGADGDFLTIWLSRAGGTETLVRDLADDDHVTFLVKGDGPGFVDDGTLFDALDRNGDEVINRLDNGTRTVGGVPVEVAGTADDLTLILNDNPTEFAGTPAITADQWFL